MAETQHGTAILCGTAGVLIRGPSGAGKSRLALAMILAGSRLVADDRVFLAARAGRLIASPPGPLRGLLEVRGRGLARFPAEGAVVLRLVADFRDPGEAERMPEPGDLAVSLLGVGLPRIFIPGEVADARLRLELALAEVSGHFRTCPPGVFRHDGGPFGPHMTAR